LVGVSVYDLLADFFNAITKANFMNQQSSYLTTKEVAAMLRIAPQTLEKARSTGLGPQIPFIKVGRAVRYASDDVTAWIETMKNQ
jgi:excisionase family DNA binding protein